MTYQNKGYENVQKCSQQIQEKIHFSIEKCVRDKLPEFIFPKPKNRTSLTEQW